jgi:hypothetical protein
MAAGVTLLQVTAEGGSPAEFNGAHHAPLPAELKILCIIWVAR